MKTQLLIILLFQSFLLHSQSIFSFYNYGQVEPPKKAGAVGSLNPWFGSKLGYSLIGEGNISNGFFATGQFQIPLISKNNFALPLVTNVGAFKSKIKVEDAAEITEVITDLASEDTGVVFGLHPAFDLTRKGYSSIYGQLQAKWNRFVDTETEDKTDIIQLRMGLGYEFGLLPTEAAGRTTHDLIISINPIFSIYNTKDLADLLGEENMSSFTGEFTAIYRLTQGVGLLAEYILGEKLESPFNIGVIFSFEKAKSEIVKE